MSRAALVAAACCFLGLPSSAATPALAEPVEDEDADGEAQRELNRILHLRSGQTVRAKARWKDGRWEYRANRRWTALPEGLVERVVLEREALAKLRSLRQEIGDDDHGRRVELARWMVNEGLVAESLEELSRVLERSPHHASALELLAERRFVAVPSLDVPEEQRQEAMVALFDWALEMPRAGQELAMLEFARVRDREGFQDDVAKALGSHSFVRRAFAARMLGRLFPGQETERLLVHAVLDASEVARAGAADALAAAEAPELTVPVVRALESRHSVVRRNAAEALGNMGYAAAVPALISHLAQATSGTRAPHSHVFFGRQFAYVQDFDVEVAQFQSIADPQINVLVEGSVQDSAVQASREEVTVVERATTRTSLSKLTGENPGRTTRAWLDWWEEHEDEWAPPAAVSAQEG